MQVAQAVGMAILCDSLADEPEVGDEGGGRGGNAGDDLYNDHEKGEGARGDEDAMRCDARSIR